MADKKISQLEQATTPLEGGELVPIVQNGETVRVEASEFIIDTSEFVKDSDLADVATSGDYNDLENLPTIPQSDEFVEKTGDTMTGALNIDASGTALSVPNGGANFSSIQLNDNKVLKLGTQTAENGFSPTMLFSTGTQTYLDLGNLDSNLFIRDRSDASTIRFTFQKSAGRLGINTTDPQAKLDVNGDLRTHSLLEKSKNGSVSGGSYLLDWNAYGNHDIIITQNTEIMQGDIPPLGYSQVITLNIIGDYALTLPTEWEIKNGGTYDGVNGSQIVVQSWDNGNFYTVIN